MCPFVTGVILPIGDLAATRFASTLKIFLPAFTAKFSCSKNLTIRRYLQNPFVAKQFTQLWVAQDGLDCRGLAVNFHFAFHLW